MDTRFKIWSGIMLSSLLFLGLAAFGCSGDDGSQSKDESQPGCASGVCKPPATPATPPAAKQEAAPAEINAAVLKLLMESGVSMKVFDARTGKYDDGRRVPGAGSLSPISKPEEVARAIPDKNQLVVTYCTNLKCPASSMLAKHLRELGYKNVIEYPNGIEGWAAAGYPVQRAK